MGRIPATRIRALLAHPRQPAVVIALAVVLVLPALRVPLFSDDYIHAIRLSPTLTFPGFDDPPWDLFAFASGDPEQRRELMEAGAFAWWTADGFKMAFWRPLSVATHALDHRLWAHSSALMHAHSIVWFGLLLVLLRTLYRRFHAPWIAGLALLLYAVDDARGMVVTFVANRNALVAAVFAVAALIAHDRWCRDGWRPGVTVAPLLLGLGLLAGESALALAGYLVAYALCIDRAPLSRRLARLAPYAVVVLAWVVAYRALGYGTHASGIYINPADEPARFFQALVVRLPVVLLGQIAGPPSDLWLLYTVPVAASVYALALLVLGVAAAVLRPVLRQSAVARFWTLGAILAAVPICATFPSDRLLVFVGIGAMGTIAMVLGAALDPDLLPGALRGSAWSRATVIFLVLIHLCAAPLLLPLRSLTGVQLAAAMEAAGRSLPDHDGLRDQTLVVVSAPADGMVAYMPPERAARGLPRPKRLRLLASSVAAVQVRRLDAFTLRIRPLNGYYSSEIERMVRGLSEPMAPGTTVALSDMTVTVTAVTDDGRAAEADFRFRVPLEDPSLLWMRWQGAALAAYVPPGIGESHTLPPTDLTAALLGE